MKKFLYIIVSCIFFTCCTTSPSFDLLILNGKVYDAENGFQEVDLGIKGDLLIEMGDLKTSKSRRIIDADGLIVSPGFIDLHAHLEPIFELSNCESLVRQGVTTSLGGPDGKGPSPFREYLDRLEEIGVGMNVGFLVGHNTLRRQVMALDNRVPTSEELKEMKILVAKAMEEGAFGISTGLKYLPGNFSQTPELIALSKEVSQRGGIYTSHLRDEGVEILASIDEAISIAEEADIPVILTHHKVIGKPMWGKSDQTLARVDAARKNGLNIMLDQYPYNASYTGISVLIPSWAQAGGNKAFIKRLENTKLRDSIKKGVIYNILNDRGGDDLSRIQFAKVDWMPSLEGQTLKFWCELKGLAPSLENGAELVLQAQAKGGASCVFFAMDDQDVERIMKHPQTMIASDGRLVKMGDGHPHPRWYGTFPRVLGRYVRDQKILSLENALKKMTALPAKAMGLKDRGLLAVGKKADVTIFNAHTVIDKATFKKPHQYPQGIHYVIINGQIVVDQGEFTNVKAGKILRK